MPNTDDLRTGDWVTMKTGEVRMWVEEVTDDGHARCVWTVDEISHDEWFPTSSLVLVEKRKRRHIFGLGDVVEDGETDDGTRYQVIGLEHGSRGEPLYSLSCTGMHRIKVSEFHLRHASKDLS